MWLDTWFGLVIGFIDYLQTLTASNHSALANPRTLTRTKSFQSVFASNCLVTDPNNSLSCSRRYRLTNPSLRMPTHSRLQMKVSQSYFTTGGLPSVSPSWRQAPWGLRPEFFFFFVTEPLRWWPLCNLLPEERMGLCLMNMLVHFPRIHIAHITCYWH
jgi:hypothetical protein